MFTEAKRRANEKWRKNHMDYVAEKARLKYHQNEQFRQLIREYNLERYYIKKECLAMIAISPEIFQ